MKKILSLFMLVMCFAVGANAQNFGTTSDGLSWKIENGVLTISGFATMSDYSTSDKAPWSGKSFTSVVIEDGVEAIGNFAFYGANTLVSIRIPASVAYIGTQAFDRCAALREIYWLRQTAWDYELDNVFGGLTQNLITVYALSVSYVTNFWAGLSVQSGQLYCNNEGEILWTLSNDNGLVVWSDKANNDGSLAGVSGMKLAVIAIALKDGVTTMTSEGGLLLSDNSTNVLLASKKNALEIPSNVTSVGDYAFYNSEVTSLTLCPKQGPELGSNVFKTSRNSKKVSFSLLFKNLASLQEAETNYANWFDAYDFTGSMSFKERSTSGTLGSGLGWSVINGKLTLTGSGVLSTTDDEIESWNALEITDVVVNNGVTEISDFAFYHLGATSFTIPASVTTIGANAFYGNGGATYNFNSNIALGDAGIIADDATLNLQLNDDDDLALNANTFDNVTYNREFKVDATGTMIVPFEPTNIPATFKVYTLSSFSNKVMTFKQVDRVQANTPYIYKNETGRKITLSATGEVSLNPVSDEHNVTTDSGWEMHGLYKKSTVDTGNSATSAADYDGNSKYWTYSSANQDKNGFGVFKNVINRVNVYPYRVYFTGLTFNQVFNNAAGGSVGAYVPERSLSVEFVDLDGTTSITEITIDGAGNIGSAVEEGVYYDLSGRRVENPTTGIYILNGKKVLVK